MIKEIKELEEGMTLERFRTSKKEFYVWKNNKIVGIITLEDLIKLCES